MLKALRFAGRLLQDISISPLALIACVIPRRRNLWCFGACEGQRYADHSRMLFEEVNKECGDICAVWLTRSREVYRALADRGLPVVMACSISGLRTTLRAAVCVYTHYARDHNAPAAVGAFRVQLWHGIPLKRFQADNNLILSKKRNWRYRLVASLNNARVSVFNWHRPNWDLLIFQSELDRARTGSALRGRFKNGAVLGSIRAQWLARRLVSRRSSNAMRILYAPTHRELGEVSLFQLVPVPPRALFSAMLKAADAEIIVRMHPYQAHETLPDGFSSSAVNICENEAFKDIYESLAESDVVITDYSSVFIDALSVGIPVVCLAPDRENYRSADQGFYSNIEEFPGPVVDTWEQALATCKSMFHEGHDPWRRARQRAIAFYFGSQAPQETPSMARVVAKIRHSVA